MPIASISKRKYFFEVFEIVSRIPSGFVTTYGSIAKYLKTSPRVVGNILHLNLDPVKYPCHRVVNSFGCTSVNYAFGGSEMQAQKLRNEGVKIVKNKVDLCRHYWDPNTYKGKDSHERHFEKL